MYLHAETSITNVLRAVSDSSRNMKDELGAVGHMPHGVMVGNIQRCPKGKENNRMAVICSTLSARMVR